MLSITIYNISSGFLLYHIPLVVIDYFFFISLYKLQQEIITFVKKPELLHHGVFRPSLSQLDIPEYVRQCLRSCWEEDPELRPDIRLVRMKLKELQAGL